MTDLESLLSRGEVDAAAALAARRLGANPADSEALLAQARLQIVRQDYPAAADLIARAEAAGGEDTAAWRAILAEAAGDPRAVSLLETACATTERPEPHFVLGRLLNQHKRFDRARPRLERALALAPGHALAHFQLAYALMELGEVPAGFSHLRECLRLNPLYGPAYLVAARMLAGNGQTSDARKLLEQGLRALPGAAPLQQELARLGP
jgi:tetratricopeptide (TPR) repeat protein